MQGVDTVQVISTQYGPNITTCLSNGGASDVNCVQFSDRELDVFESRLQPIVYLQHMASQNTARVRADFTPSYNRSWNYTETKYASSYVFEIIPDDVNGNGDYSIRNISGLVHTPRVLSKYLNTLPFCWNNENVWVEYYNSVSMVALRSMAPCKTYQKNRDNFVFLHTAKLNSGTESVYNTVLAFYKTPKGRNRVVDVQSGLNLLLVAFSIDATLFDLTAIADMAVDIVYDFMDKSYANWPALNNLNS